MRKTNKKRTIVHLCEMLTIALLTTSCNSDAFFGFDEDYTLSMGPTELLSKDSKRIAESEEFQEFVIAQLEFANRIIAPEDSSKIFIDSLNVYRVYFKEQREKVQSAYNQLIERYPQYKMLSKQDQYLLYDYCITSVLKEPVGYVRHRSIVRTKSANSECMAHTLVPANGSGSGFSLEPFCSCYEAIMRCIDYSTNRGVESGGYIFVDGSAIFVIDQNAESNHMDLPILRWNDETAPVTAFHFHFNSGSLSNADNAAQEQLPCNLMVITADYYDR